MMGSFTNQLWELSDIEIPSDLDSTILFKFDEAKKAPRKPKPKNSKRQKLVIGVVIVVIGIGAFFGWKKFFILEELNVEQVSDDAVIIQATAFKKKTPIPDPEAERLFKQLKGIAASLEPVAQSTAPKEAPKKEASKEDVATPDDEPAVSTPASSSDAYALHWHIPYFTETDVKKLVGTITMLNIDPDYDDQNFVIFKAISKRIKTISAGIQFTYKIELDLPEFISDGSDPEREINASISFTGREPSYSVSGGSRSGLSSFERDISAANSLDWHILLVSSDQNALIDIIHRNRGTVEFTSKEVVIFSMPGARIGALAQEIQGTGGMFADFGDSDFDIVSALGVINVLVYFPEQ